MAIRKDSGTGWLDLFPIFQIIKRVVNGGSLTNSGRRNHIYWTTNIIWIGKRDLVTSYIGSYFKIIFWVYPSGNASGVVLRYYMYSRNIRLHHTSKPTYYSTNGDLPSIVERNWTWILSIRFWILSSNARQWSSCISQFKNELGRIISEDRGSISQWDTTDDLLPQYSHILAAYKRVITHYVVQCRKGKSVVSSMVTFVR